MNCEACGRENQPDSRFCGACGSPLARSCVECGRELAADLRFCDGCGHAVDDAAAPPGPSEPTRSAVRKTVTALFCDLVGSTAFGEQVDAESSRDAMSRYRNMTRTVIESHGGTVYKFIGDGVMALFGVPEMAEDDAERAVRCGLALQMEFDEVRRHISTRHGIDVGLRVGVNTGEVVVADGDEDLVGDSLNTAARLEAACTPGFVLVGEPTWRLTRATVDFGSRREIRAKGKEELVGCYEVVQIQAPAPEVVTPFVGRDDELSRLRVVLEDTIRERRAKMVTVIGSPGVGKTRLAREMRASVEGGTTVFELRCERSGTATFAPIAELLRSVAGITDAHSSDEMARLVRATVVELHDADRVSELLAGFVGAGPIRSTEEMFFAVRRLFEALGTGQPVVLVVDDIQWAEPLFLDLLEHLAEWVQTVPLLVVGLARPEIREVRPVITEPGRRVAEVINLEGLSRADTSELAAKLVGADSLPGDLLAKIPESTEGNPLFVRELMRMLVDDGVIANRSGTWEMVIDVDAVEVPTISLLLASRVERMPPDERRVLELAAVVGSEFPIGAVEAASGEHDRRQLEATFERLRRKELIEPAGTYWGDEPVFRFHHVLIRDAAYRRLLKGVRAELHLAVGEWTERSAESLIGEHEVTTAHHFEQAYQYRRQLDLDDDTTRALGERAAALLATAAKRALEREDLAAAGSLAARALDCIADESAGVAELLLIGCEALLGTHNVAAGAPLVDRLGRVAAGHRRLEAWAECFRAELAISTDPSGLERAEQRADAAARQLEELGDQAGVAKARLQRAAALARLGRIGDCESELDLALSAARAADDLRRVTAVLGEAPIAALWGPSPVPRAGGRCLDVVRLLRITAGSPAVEATSIRCQAVLEALRGRHDTARTMLEASRATLEELGLSHGLLETELYAGLVELLADDPVAAEPFLRRAYQGLGRMGIGADAGQAAAHLARSLLLQGRLDEADTLAAESDALAGQNPQTAIVSRSVQAEVSAARGEHAAAISLAEEAVHLAGSTDILVDHANAVATMARVLAAAGDTDGAAAAMADAAALYERKGVTVSLGVTPAGRDRLETPAALPAPDEFWNEAHRLASQTVRLLNEFDFDAWASYVAPDFVHDDRRAIVRSAADDLTALVGELQSASTILSPRVVSFEPIAARGDDLILMQPTWVYQGTGAETTWLGLTQWSGGQMVRMVLFDEDELEAAIAELDRLHQADMEPFEALSFGEFADMDAATSAKDVERLLDWMDPSFEVIDHRRLGWPTTTGLAGWLERAQTLFEAAETLIVVTTRYHRVCPAGAVTSRHYRVTMANGASPTDAHVIVWGLNVASGCGTRIEQFDQSDLAAALARYDELEDEFSPLDTCRAVEIGGAVNVLARSRRTLSLNGIVAPECVFERGDDEATPILTQDDLRALGFGGPNRTAIAVRDERLALIDMGLADGTRVYRVEEIDENEQLVRIRQFAGDQLADAMDHMGERWFEMNPDLALKNGAAIVAPRAIRAGDTAAVAPYIADDVETDRPAVVEVVNAFIASLNAGDLDAISALMDPEIDYVSYPQLVDPGGEAPELLAAMASLVADNRTFTAVPVAVATEHMGVFRIRTVADNDFFTEWACLVALGDDGRADTCHVWSIEDLRLAFAACRGLYLEAAEPAEVRLRRPWIEIEISGNTDPDPELAASYLCEDMVVIDHQALRLFNQLDASSWVKLQMAFIADYPTRAVWIEAVADDGDVTLEWTTRWADPTHVEPDWTMLSVTGWRDGRIERMETFDVTQEAEARARFEELAKEGKNDRTFAELQRPVVAEAVAGAKPSLRENAATRCRHRLGALIAAEAFDRFGDEVDDDHRFEDRRSTVSLGVIEGCDAFAEATAVTYNLGFRFGASDGLAVRGDDHCLARTTLSTADGQEISRLALHVLGPTGRLAHMIMFDTDDRVAAEAELDRRWMGTLDPEQAAVYGRMRECAEAVMFGNADKVAGYLAGDFRSIDSRSLGWGEVDRSQFLTLVAARPATFGEGDAFISDFQFHDGPFVMAFEEHTTSPAFALRATRASVAVGRVGSDGTGRFDIFDFFAEDEMEAALTRVAELQ